MKVCIAQIKSEKGTVQKNIQNHFKFINRAIELNSDLVVFPELSITNYEPELANELATNLEDSIFNPFQDLSDENKITIGIGMPVKTIEGVTISMLIFQPSKERIVYSKRLLHPDELPYFVSSNNQPAQKWLKDRKERTLEFDDILHYQKIIVALSETDRLMKEIDKIEIE